MSKHSPGPWRWERNVWTPADSPEWHETGRLVDANGATILCAEAEFIGSTEADAWVSVLHADARLIAAAPTMLEMLREAYLSDEGEPEFWERVYELLRKVDGDETP